MIFTFVFVTHLCRLLLDGAPLFLGLGLTIGVLAIAIGKREGWNTADSLYFGFITATTVGYGDLTPKQGWGKFSAVMLSIIGLIATGILVALAIEAANSTYDQLAG
jgi:voltage-gated potassium channel